MKITLTILNKKPHLQQHSRQEIGRNKVSKTWVRHKYTDERNLQNSQLGGCPMFMDQKANTIKIWMLPDWCAESM